MISSEIKKKNMKNDENNKNDDRFNLIRTLDRCDGSTLTYIQMRAAVPFESFVIDVRSVEHRVTRQEVLVLKFVFLLSF